MINERKANEVVITMTNLRWQWDHLKNSNVIKCK